MEIIGNAKEEDQEIGCKTFQGDGSREGQVQATVPRASASCQVRQEEETSGARRRALQERGKTRAGDAGVVTAAQEV